MRGGGSVDVMDGILRGGGGGEAGRGRLGRGGEKQILVFFAGDVKVVSSMLMAFGRWMVR